MPVKNAIERGLFISFQMGINDMRILKDHISSSSRTSIVILHPCIEQLYALISFASWKSQLFSVKGLSRNAPIIYAIIRRETDIVLV